MHSLSDLVGFLILKMVSYNSNITIELIFKVTCIFGVIFYLLSCNTLTKLDQAMISHNLPSVSNADL